jgi:hypothetical protein
MNDREIKAAAFALAANRLLSMQADDPLLAEHIPGDREKILKTVHQIGSEALGRSIKYSETRE